MIPIYKIKLSETSIENNVYQEIKSQSQHIADYMNGNASPEVPMHGSMDFDTGDAVDFDVDLVPTHHNIFEVASGQDKVFNETVPTDPIAPPSIDPNVSVVN